MKGEQKMKSHIGWKGMLVSLSILIICIGTFRYAIGDVAFPNIFTAGTPAVASQVNANFQAINARQTAAFANLAGTYYINDIQKWRKADPRAKDVKDDCSCHCTSSFQGTMILTADGKASASGTKTEECTCDTSCCPNTITISLSGTYTVNADGSGIITLTEVKDSKVVVAVPLLFTETYAYQASKDLNTLMLNEVANNSLGMALRK
jgi:hypothetical protein